MSDEDTPGDPLDQVFADPDDRPDDVDLTDDVSIETQEFHDQLTQIAEAAESLRTLSADLEALRKTGLQDSDVVYLLYGRNRSLNKSTIEQVIDSLDDVDRKLERGRHDLLKRLVADVGNVSIRDTESVFDELESLHKRYGRE